MKLDRKQPYGQISGEHFGAAFEQNGRFFDADGDEIVVAEPVITPPEKAAETKTAPKAAPAAKAKPGKKPGAPKKPVVAAPTESAPASELDSQIAAQGL